MSVIFLGIFVAVALIILGQKFPQFQPCRWMIFLELLRWKGIEATSHLAESSNAKVVVIGGKDGLPLIFNVGEEAKPVK